MKWFEHQRIRYTLNHHPIPREVWERLMREADIFRGLSAVERAHLRELATLFLHRKILSGVQGLTVSTEMAMVVTTKACLLILKPGLDYFDGWVEVVMYPGAFRVARDSTDATGLISHQEHALTGSHRDRCQCAADAYLPLRSTRRPPDLRCHCRVVAAALGRRRRIDYYLNPWIRALPKSHRRR